MRQNLIFTVGQFFNAFTGRLFQLSTSKRSRPGQLVERIIYGQLVETVLRCFHCFLYKMHLEDWIQQWYT